LSINTVAVFALGVNCAVISTPHAAVFWTTGGWHEPVNTLAARLIVYDFAECVRTARILARINATMLMTDGMHWTILGTRAVSFRLATIHIRIADMIRWALTHRVVRWTSDTQRSRMTRVRMTCLHGDAFDIGYWVRAKPRRTLADRFMIFCYADRVYTTCILVAGVITSVRKSVAELRRWTVNVVNAGHRATSRR